MARTSPVHKGHKFRKPLTSLPHTSFCTAINSSGLYFEEVRFVLVLTGFITFLLSFRSNFGLYIVQGCGTYGTRAQNGTRFSLLSCFLLLLFDQLLWTVKNMCIYINMTEYYSCYQIILRENTFTKKKGGAVVVRSDDDVNENTNLMQKS